jgi:hypothetical protein
VQVGELPQRAGHHLLRWFAGLAAQPLSHPDAGDGDVLEPPTPRRYPHAQQYGGEPAHHRYGGQQPEDRSHRVAGDQQSRGHDQRQRDRGQHAGHDQREGGRVVLDLAAVEFPVGEGDGEPGTGDGHTDRQRVAGEDDPDRLGECQPLTAGPQQPYLHAGKRDHRGPLAEQSRDDPAELRVAHPGQSLAQLVVLGDHQPHHPGQRPQDDGKVQQPPYQPARTRFVFTP